MGRTNPSGNKSRIAQENPEGASTTERTKITNCLRILKEPLNSPSTFGLLAKGNQGKPIKCPNNGRPIIVLKFRKKKELKSRC